MKWMCWLGVALCAVPGVSNAQDAPFLTRTFNWENDVYLTDEKYTNGLRYGTLVDAGPSWAHHARHHWLWKRLLPGVKPCGPACQGRGGVDEQRVRTGIAFGQNFYTPTDLRRAAPNSADRPYGSFVYLGRVFEVTAGSMTHEIEYDAGIVGPLALGESVQKGWHSFVGAVRPEGWDNQIPNSPAVQGRLSTHYYLSDADTRSFDVVPRTRVVVGTPITHAGAGAMVRAGFQIPRGIGGRIVPTVVLSEAPPAPAPAAPLEEDVRDVTRQRRQGWQRAALELRQSAERPRDRPAPLYLFAGGEAVGVAHNAFLEGPLFRDGPEAPPLKRGYLEYEAGFVARLPSLGRRADGSGWRVRWRGPDATVRLVGRGPEFDGADWHRYWALNLTW